VEIGQIVKNWQQYFDIQNGSSQPSTILNVGIIDMFQIEVLTFSLILVKIGQRVKKYLKFF